MKAQTIRRTAKDGKLFTITVGGETNEWMIDWDNSFTFRTKAEAVKNARLVLKNQVEDYEYDNELK